MEELYLEELKEKYHANISNYYLYLDLISSTLKRFLNEADIEYNILEGRVKSFDSFLRKYEVKRKKYSDPFEEMTDLIGIRIVTYYREDVDAVIKIIFKNFEIDFSNSINKLVNMEPDRMGYLSVHYVCRLKPENFNNANEKLAGMGFKFEIQIRTALQHAWAAIDHKLRYKTLVNLPKKIERKLFRISALLEVADSEFSRIKDEIGAIEQFYKKKISDENYHIRLDLSTISFYLKFNDKLILSALEKLQVYHYNTFDIAKEEKMEKKLLNYGLQFGFNKVEDLHQLLMLLKNNEDAINKHLDLAIKEKLRYLINSACTFFITMLLMLYEKEESLKKIYRLSDESMENVINLRKELLKKNEN
ncbi:MAG: hypothetical protein JXM74_03885 [Fusobacteriaceae bacterium]|nr:hypothetical protein [Fusobacteriaceae bacterium]